MQFGRESQTLYAGFDPTSDSLHVGNLLVLMGLLQSQRGGHTPIALLGGKKINFHSRIHRDQRFSSLGATGKIGDPSGRKSERTAMEVTTLDHNLASIRKQIERIFENHKQLFWDESAAKDPLKDLM